MMLNISMLVLFISFIYFIFSLFVWKMKHKKIKRHVETAGFIFVVGILLLPFGFQEKEKQRDGDALEKNQETFVSFIKDFASQNKKVTNTLDEFQKQSDLLENGNGNRQDVLNATSNAYAFTSEAIPAMWKLEVPSELPSNVEGDLNSALSSINDSFYMRKLALKTAEKIFNNEQEGSLDADFEMYSNTADKFVEDSTSLIIAAGEILQVSPDEIKELLEQK